jgi:hypothetical protein
VMAQVKSPARNACRIGSSVASHDMRSGDQRS